MINKIFHLKIGTDLATYRGTIINRHATFTINEQAQNPAGGFPPELNFHQLKPQIIHYGPGKTLYCCNNTAFTHNQSSFFCSPDNRKKRQ